MLPSLVLLLSLAVPPAAESARDAFLEGWFQETAEGDLEAALRAYRECVERGGPAEAALVAKAKLRMARIAGARGEREAERGLMEEVVERFAGTPAAAEAAAALEEGTATGTGTADAAVAEAWAFLDEMLGGEGITIQKANLVLSRLSVDEVLDRYRRKGGTLYGVLQRVRDPELAPQLVSMAVRAGDLPGISQAAIVTLGEVARGEPVPRPLIELAEENRAGVASTVLQRLAEAGQIEEILGVYRRNEALRGHEVLRTTVDDGGEIAADVLELAVGRMREADLNLADRLPADALGAENAVGERLRSLFPTWPAEQRDGVAVQAFHHARKEGASRALLDLLLADPEPDIRGYAETLLIESDDPDRRREGFERFVARPRPLDVGWLMTWVGREVQPHWRAAIALVPAGSLRECVYGELLRSGWRSPAEVIEVGLERGDPELIRALFRPRWWRDEDLRQNGRAPIRPWAQRLRNGAEIHVVYTPLLTSLGAHPDADLGRRLAEVALSSSDEEVRRGVAGLVLMGHEDRVFRGVLDLLAADGAAAIRLFAVNNAPLEAFGPATRAALLLDPDPTVAREALGKCRDADALIAAGERADPDRLIAFAERALRVPLPAAVAALYPKLPTDEKVASRALESLAEADVQVVLDGLDRGDPLPNFVSVKARELLWGLPLPEDLRSVIDRVPGDRAAVEALAGAVRARRDEFEAAFRTSRLDGVRRVTLSGGTMPHPVRALAVRLVDLGGRELAREFVRTSHQRAIEVGGLALVAFGETEALREAFAASPFPANFLLPALEAGLDQALVAAVDSGRLDPAVVLQVALREGRPDVVAAVLLGPDQEPRRVFLEPNQASPEFFSATVDHLVRERAVDRLATMVLLYDSVPAVRALFQLEAYDTILENIGAWAPDPRKEAMTELKRRTGIPEPTQDWPRFRADQEAMVKAWREALGKEGEER